MSTALTGQHIGRAHYAVRALLEQKLAPAGFGFETWIPLNAVGTGGPITPRDLIVFVTGGLRISEQRARESITTLVEAGYLTVDENHELALTDSGRQLWTRVDDEVRPLTGYLFAGFTEAEKATAASVLLKVTERADAALG
ncbi:hypothetical protein [Kineosporia sp. NBRC 101731]|uniref:MarR family winged helix-turn-helix transcriptional regulator n=1 Tax=Kineosporia sp. NBRC 101731 TaxID=3032199 RepID=UPI0024A17446|nr:hypothetical protein [Kineosporia sp. NBRC 101731]GLY30243.1 hypothetical protein Kisp02_36080 [Kineosporia sp. NBRC 101731]